MSYRFKGHKVILEGDINQIVPASLPVTPVNGQLVIDSSDNKYKVYNSTLVRWITLGDALDQLFDNSSNGFTSENTQEAIEEAKSTAISKSRFTIICTFNGTVGNNNWLGYSEVLPGNQVPVRLPIKCRLKEMQFSYTQSNIVGIPTGSEQIDGRFDLYKNGLTSPANVVYQASFTNNAGGKYFTGVNVDFDPGDFMVGRWTDQGDSPSDMAITYFFEVLE